MYLRTTRVCILRLTRLEGFFCLRVVINMRARTSTQFTRICVVLVVCILSSRINNTLLGVFRLAASLDIRVSFCVEFVISF